MDGGILNFFVDRLGQWSRNGTSNMGTKGSILVGKMRLRCVATELLLVVNGILSYILN